MSKRNQQQGSATEEFARLSLTAMGFRMLHKIETPKVFGHIFKAKVPGDLWGIVPGSGRSVLVECKYRPEKLLFSALEDHQVTALRTHSTHGGLSILFWQWEAGFAALEWPIVDFRPGVSLSPERAMAVAIKGVP